MDRKPDHSQSDLGRLLQILITKGDDKYGYTGQFDQA